MKKKIKLYHDAHLEETKFIHICRIILPSSFSDFSTRFLDDCKRNLEVLLRAIFKGLLNFDTIFDEFKLTKEEYSMQNMIMRLSLK
jgi:hypothetical protein